MSMYLDMPLRSLEDVLLETKGIVAVHVQSYDAEGYVLTREEEAIDNTVYPTRDAAINAGLGLK